MPPSPLPDLPFDFTHRVDPALLPEWMDEPGPYEPFRDCVRDIAATTQLTLAYAPILAFLHRAAQRSGGEPLRILDVGSGGGDVLRRIALWAGRRRLRVELTGIDLNPYAARAAAEFCGSDPRFAGIRWLTGDVFTDPAVQNPDLVLSSLVTHHMHYDEIVRFLRWMEGHARRGWLISDLLRSQRSYALFGPLARVMRWHPFVQHDGLVSIRRAFRAADWHALLAKAEIPTADVRFGFGGLGRLRLTRYR